MDWLQILCGFAIGFIVGLTGVGGGSLMTPLLIIGFAVPAPVAVGTDLLFAAITKSGGVLAHHSRRTVDWPVTLKLAAGSAPAALLTAAALHFWMPDTQALAALVKSVLGVALLLTALALLFKRHLARWSLGHPHLRTHRATYTVLLGLLLGAMVTISSVGAGAVGVAALLLLYPEKPAVQIVGTDIAHAVPLTLIAGLAHAKLGSVDLWLLLTLLIGSLPGIALGSRLSTRMNEAFLRTVLMLMLSALGIKMIV